MAVGVKREAVLLALHKAFSERPGVLREVFDQCEGEVEQLVNLTEHELVGTFEESADSVRTGLESLEEAEFVADELESREVDIVLLTDPGYPRKLKDLMELPPILYVSGDVSIAEDYMAVGVCGSRAASQDGLEFARRAGEVAADLDFVVVSGGARGVDTEAHLGALDNGGRAILVLAEGIARYRMTNRLAESASPTNTLLVSQFYPKHTWQVSRAMARNATICGMSEAMLVVEAGETGGTLAAGKECLKQGKRLLVVEHPNLEEQAPGNRILLSKDGEAIRNPDEFRTILPSLSSEDRRDGIMDAQLPLLDFVGASMRQPAPLREESVDYHTQDDRHG